MPILKKILSSLAVSLLLTATAFGDGSTDYDASGVAKFKKGDLDGALVDFNKAVGLNPDDPSPRLHRGIVKETKDDLDGALADFNKSIDLKPDYAPAYNSRGMVKKTKGDWDGALADYDYAIQLKPEYSPAYDNRGNLKRVKGDLDGALADYNKAIGLNPKSGRTYHNRGCLHYDTQEFTMALADFRKSCALDPSLDYAYSRIWLIRARLGEREPATSGLRTYLENRKTGKPDDWPSQIARFLAGQLTEPGLFKAAENADKNTEAGQLCEAWFYSGSKHLIDGDKATATDYFNKCLGTEKKAFAEYQSATAELKVLKAGK